MNGILPIGRLAFVFTFSTFSVAILAQNNRDSSGLVQLKKELTTAQTAIDTWSACRKLSDALKDTAVDRAIMYEYQALKIAEQAGLEPQRHVSFVRLADCYNKTAEFDKAVSYLQKCDPDAMETTLDKYSFHRLCGIVLGRNALNDSARIHCGIALQMSIELNDDMKQASIYNLIGTLLAGENRFSESIVYFIEARERCKKVNNKRAESSVLANIALNHLQIEEYKKALDYALESRDVAVETTHDPSIAFALSIVASSYQGLRAYEAALEALHEAITLFDKLGYSGKLQEAYTTLGEIQLTLDRKAEARETLLKSVNMLGDQNTKSKASAYGLLGTLYISENQFRKGFQCLDSALMIAGELKILELAWQSHEWLSNAYAKANKIDLAHQHLRQFVTLKDSALRLEKRNEFQALEARYKNQLKEESIRNLQAENKLKDMQLYLMTLAAILIAVTALFIYFRYRNNLRVRKKLQDLDKLKSRFFVNISHEYRTPLSLIMAPLRKHLESDTQNGDKEEFALMYRNAERLNTLTNQLLELAKLESGSSKLMVQHIDISSLLSIIYSYFVSRAADNQIRYEFIKPDNPIMGWIDADKIEQVVCNLLSNAFKFTPGNGAILLKAALEHDRLTIEVHDTGPGIPAGHTNLIFNRFYQVAESARTTHGSGIGLTLCKEIMDLHRGSIVLTSTGESGSIFSITLPIGRGAYKADEIAADNVIKMRKTFAASETTIFRAEISNTSQDESLPLVLIVEDNHDMNVFLQRTLEKDYRVIAAANGAEGWRHAVESVPDVIISDIMMPEMDGIEMCRKIRKHDITCHIPLIMLTARADQASRIEGLTTGADVYLSKPFDPQELFIHVGNLLRRREEVRKFIMKQTRYEAPESSFPVELPGADKIFMEKLNVIMKLRHGDEAFDVDEFAGEIGMSRTQFYRKVKALTGLSPGELIRDFRLALACTLLKQQGIHVNEVCYKVGFSSVSNFIKIFKDHTGYTPGEYKAAQEQTTEALSYKQVIESIKS